LEEARSAQGTEGEAEHADAEDDGHYHQQIEPLRAERLLRQDDGQTGGLVGCVVQRVVLLLVVVGAPDGHGGDAGQEYDEHHTREDGSASR